MQHLDVILPIALVIIAFLLKLFMDRNATVPLIIRSFYELPVDIIFLTLSFTTAFTISSTKNMESGLFHLFMFFVIALIVVVLWRRGLFLFEKDYRKVSATLFVFNGTLAGYSLYRAIALLVKVSP